MIYVIREKQVMLDSDLALLYQVETKALNQAVKRHLDRFPEGFRFQLSEDEYESLRSQIVTSMLNVDLREGYGQRRKNKIFADDEQKKIAFERNAEAYK